MTGDWTPLEQELAVWRAETLALRFWWRDDDATDVTPELTQLADLSSDLGVPVHLAVVPKFATTALARMCATGPSLIPLVHGWAHENRAPLIQKKAEFGHPRSTLADDAGRALRRITVLFGEDHLPCFVPPWNRIADDLIPRLHELGYASLSTFGPRAARLAAPGLIQINTHIDPINWRGDRSVVAPDQLISKIVTLLRDRRTGRADASEPLGLLTHHLVHDGPIWDFTRGVIETLLGGGATPVNLFDQKDNLP